MEELVKSQLVSAAAVTIFSNAIKDKDILNFKDAQLYIDKSKELALKLIESL